MRKLFLFTLCLLALLVFTGGKRFITGEPHGGTQVLATDRAITFYVSSGGSDTNDCLTVGNACLTVQEAVDRVPRRIQHDVTINVGSGSFAGFDANGLNIDGGVLTIEGELDAPTMDGSSSGTTTGGDTDTCTDTLAGWTTNQLRGEFVLVGGTDYRVIRSNTSTSLELTGALPATCSGKTYSILEPKTTFNSGGGAAGYGRIEVEALSAYLPDSFLLKDLEVDTSGKTIGVFMAYGVGCGMLRVQVRNGTYAVAAMGFYGGFDIEQSYITGATYGVVVQRGAAKPHINDTLAYNNTTYGFWVVNSFQMDFDDVYGDSNGTGLMIEGTMFVDLDGGAFENNTNYGIAVDTSTGGNRMASSLLNAQGNITIASNGDGVIGRYGSKIVLTNVDGSNTGHGLILESGSHAVVTSATGVTGSTGDATINGGSTDLSWSSDFGTNGDIAINIDNGCRLERKD
jgi:hypothetical protein